MRVSAGRSGLLVLDVVRVWIVLGICSLRALLHWAYGKRAVEIGAKRKAVSTRRR